ncbi:ATP-binding protein [uncultured Clostridium sp.]|uniref:ATP-binding protein n=1 Tax=uncultured Clostridium sp. TaxID=59620 RepID=UPI002634A797|nr:ATP-binding protein [uncultured Clostridium sp.]MCI8310112.1 ATP-binding protein [Clostridia bacterium]
MEIKRDDYLNKLINRENNGLIKVITGLRRSGKSYLLFNLYYNYLISKGIDKSHIIDIALDDRTNKELRNPDNMLKFIKEKITDDKLYYILLDEIQYLDEFEDVLNSLMHIRNADVYVTGSNSKFLSSDVITEFRGRGDEIHVFPLSFREFISVYQGTIDEAWDDYYNYGGMPLVLSRETSKEKTEYLKSLFEKVYISDILERHKKIKNKIELDELLDILSSAVGSLTNPLKLSKTFRSEKNKNIDDKTIKRYIDYFEDSFLINEAKRYDVKGKKYINSPYKYYFEDIGLRNARINFRQTEENHVMENIIYNELRIRGYNVDVGVVNVYEKNEKGSRILKSYEVDFVVTQGNNKYYIQSAFSMSNPEKIRQENNSLINIGDSFKKIIVVKDNIKPRRDENGVVTMGIFNFLTDANSLDV